MARDIHSATTMASPSRVSSSQAVRFLSFLQPPPDSDNSIATDGHLHHHRHHPPLELDESDVIWSSSASSYSSSEADSHHYHSPPPHPHPHPPPHSPIKSPATHLRRHRTHLNHAPSYGLSAALSEDHLPPLVRRKSTLNPSHSAARMVPPHVVRSETPHLSPKNVAAAGRYHQSAPVNVPVWPQNKKKGAGGFGTNYYLDQLEEVDDEVDLDDEEEMVPPHVIVARSHVTFSVFEGVGRTLKGRDLRSVRNAVFQKTGFID